MGVILFIGKVFPCFKRLHEKIRFDWRKKKEQIVRSALFSGAGNQSRTDDLVITNDVLYQLSHASIAMRLTNYITTSSTCQWVFQKKAKIF